MIYCKANQKYGGLIFMKRTLALLIAIILFATMLFSCSGQADKQQTPSNVDSLNAEIERLKQQIADQAKLITNLLAQKEEGSNKNEAPSTDDKDEDKDEDAGGDNVENAEFEYIKENGGITITRYVGSETNVRIPERIDGLPVLKIGNRAFAETKIKNITLPSVCEVIDWFAFYGCYALSGIYLSEATTSIGYGAFDGCSRSLTFYCPANSYAQKYAKSFGITYSSLN